MHYEGNIFRPPSEADSILLQVTTGCSHNKCSFCGMYKGQKFRIKDHATIQDDILFAKQHYSNRKRLFLCDGDALSLPQKRLIAILDMVRRHLPWITRIGAYANTKSIYHKSEEELTILRQHGLKIVYMGLETGDDQTLKAINKGADSRRMIDMGRKIKKSGIALSVTVLLGIAGKDRSHIHAKETGRVLSAIDPDYIGALSLMPVPGTPLHRQIEAGTFTLPGPMEMLEEIGIMLQNTIITAGLFHANHASNYLPIKAKLPDDKEAALQLIHQALRGEIGLKPEYLRAL